MRTLAVIAVTGILLAFVSAGAGYKIASARCAQRAAEAQAKINKQASTASSAAVAELRRIRGSQDARLGAFEKALPGLVSNHPVCALSTEALDAYRRAIKP